MPMIAVKRMTLFLVAAALTALLTAGSASSAFAGELKRMTFHDAIEPFSCERFVAADVFRAGKPIGARVLGTVSFNFTTFFLPAVEDHADALALEAWTLRYSGDDVSLIRSLGGEQRAVLPLCAIYRAMEMSERGSGHADAGSRFAFARSPVDGGLWAIHWFVNHESEWVIGAVDVPHPHLDWPSGARVFSRAILHAQGSR